MTTMAHVEMGVALMSAALGKCAHDQAEPVILCTGETVACVCIACLRGLPARWIEHQRQVAESIAFCGHRRLVELAELGRAQSDYTCVDCGALNPNRAEHPGTWIV